MALLKIFSKNDRKHSEAQSYINVTDFVDANLAGVKGFLSTISQGERRSRLADLATMVDCRAVLLCNKLKTGNDKFAVIDSSDVAAFPAETKFTWSHNQAAASMDASALLSALPFQCAGALGFISVPIKNSHNVTTGILLAITCKRLTNIDAKTRLLHMIAPLYNAEIECENLRQEQRQFEQRIVSLNQSIEVTSADLKREREKAKENSEFKSIFLTNLSHEIRTPMNVVLGFIDLLDTAQSDEDRQKFINIIRQNSRLMLTVIDNLIEISKLQSSYMFSPMCPQQLNILLDELKKKYEDKVHHENRDIQIVTSYALPTPNDTIWNSAEIIAKVIDQLMDNALKFTEKGEVVMGYTTSDSEMTFFVRDTGCGVEKGKEETIFQMFSVEGEDDSRDDREYSMGLELARKYLPLTDGSIWVDTQCTRGASFCFSIPNDKL